jgi:hypothetical protein
LAELAVFDAWLCGTSAPRASHAGSVSTEQRTDILVREYCRCRAGESERGTQHRAVELVRAVSRTMVLFAAKLARTLT